MTWKIYWEINNSNEIILKLQLDYLYSMYTYTCKTIYIHNIPQENIHFIFFWLFNIFYLHLNCYIRLVYFIYKQCKIHCIVQCKIRCIVYNIV